MTPSDHRGFTPRRATGHSSTCRAIALQNNFRFDDESQPDETTRTGDSNPINCYFVRWFSFDTFYTHGFHETGSSFVGCLMSPLCGDFGVSFGFHVSSAHSGTSFVGCLMSPPCKGQDGCTEEQYCLVTYTLFTIEN